MRKLQEGKTHVGERREKRPNGDIYVYKRVTAYDPQSKKTKTLEVQLLGKIPAGCSEMISTRPRRKINEIPPKIVRKHIGATDILNWIGRESGIHSDLMNSFPEGDALKIDSIARYWLATNGATLPLMSNWQIMHDLPYSSGISEKVCSELFFNVGINEEGIQKYFSARTSALGDSPIIALDSTTISTYSANLHEARYGYNKAGDGLPTIKLLTLYSLTNHEPLAFTKQPGNIPDVISITNAIKQVKCLDVQKPLIVTDNGFESERNLMEFARSNMKFLTVMNPQVNWVKEMIKDVVEDIDNINNICPFDSGIYGIQKPVTHTFKWVHKNKSKNYKKGDVEEFSRSLYVNIFFSPTRREQQIAERNNELNDLRNRLLRGETDFSNRANKIRKQFVIESRSGRGGNLHVKFNAEAVKEAQKYYGYFVLVTNQPNDVFTVLEYNRLREKIEETYAVQKGVIDSYKPRVWNGESLRGRQFVQFISLGYYCYFFKKIKEVKDRLASMIKTNGDKNSKREKKLLNWLNNRSLYEILTWFDCIEMTTIQTELKKQRWSTEMIAQDRYFLSLLGVIKDLK